MKIAIFMSHYSNRGLERPRCWLITFKLVFRYRNLLNRPKEQLFLILTIFFERKYYQNQNME